MAASIARRAFFPTYQCLNGLARCRQSLSHTRYISFSRSLQASQWFTKDHEWVTIDGQKGTVGISDYAQEKLGEIVYVELPEVGASLDPEETAGCLESVKAASDVINPVRGTVSEVNEVLKDNPSLVNSKPMDDGWLYKMDLPADVSTDDLMDANAYKEYCKTSD
ncbi:glycine cleavage system H protein [Elysia marginata]|uniref:Glycine cleavage system H protein n=1 Tax=Elysia marginata TaxID=1093978 RepID=A0AAV4H6K3_9GAST|nr:glycine cleavage system H protein [Elysia marginata]